MCVVCVWKRKVFLLLHFRVGTKSVYCMKSQAHKNTYNPGFFFPVTINIGLIMLDFYKTGDMVIKWKFIGNL